MQVIAGSTRYTHYPIDPPVYWRVEHPLGVRPPVRGPTGPLALRFTGLTSDSVRPWALRPLLAVPSVAGMVAGGARPGQQSSGRI